MKRKFTLFFISLFAFSAILVQSAYAQGVVVKGQVVEPGENGQPLVGALIKMNPDDTVGLTQRSRVAGTDIDGNFVITTNKAGSVIEVSSMGYKARRFTIEDGQATVDLGRITLTMSSLQAEEAIIVAEAPIGRIIGDTTQFNAAAFKTDPDATSAELIKKMPGVTTDDDGNVEYEGEKISKVYVNGKEYFDDDPSLALQNLPVDAVESVQFYDDLTDDAKFSGYDTGERVKTINIITKYSVMDNMIGKAFAGYGTDGRYGVGLGGNWIREDSRLAITAQRNNTNNQGFSMSDITSSSGSGRGRGASGGSGVDMSSFSTGVNGGIRETTALGLNYTVDVNDKLDISTTYFFNNVGNENLSSSTQDYMTTDRYYTSESATEGSQFEHRYYSKIEWNPNETNRITISPRVNYTRNSGLTASNTQTYEGFGGDMINSTDNQYDRRLDSYNLSADIWWQHRLKKAGRTISVGGIVYAQKSWGDYFQNSDYLSQDDDGILLPDSIRQLGYLDMSRVSLTGSFSYTEPLSERSRLNFNYKIYNDRTISDRQGWNQLDYDAAMAEYTRAELDTTTTNYMNRNTTTNTMSMGYSYNITKKFNLNASMSYQYATLNSLQEFPVIDEPSTGYNFSAALPSLSISYYPNTKNTIRFRYNTNSAFPTITQLQEILDITDITNVSTGNADLKQSFNHSLNLMYNHNNIEKNLFFMLGTRMSIQNNSISNHRRYLTESTTVDGVVIPSGAQFTSPVNLNGYMSANLFSNLTVNINPLSSKFSVMANYSYSKTPSMEDYVEYLTTTHRAAPRFALYSNIENIDFSLSYSPSITFTTAGTGQFDRYWSHSTSATVSFKLWGGGYLRGNAEWRNTYGTQEAYDNHYALVNASFTQKFWKERFEITLSGYDLLNQNNPVRQSVSDTYISTSTSTVLQRYYMVTLTWRIDTRKNKRDNESGERGERGEGGPGGPGGPGGGGPGGPGGR